jgi:uncharacterized protein DUF4149
MLALRYASALALAVWVGGLLALGGIAAPAVFDVVGAHRVPDARVVAGAIFGEALRRFQHVSYVCGAVVPVSLATRAVLGPRPRRFALRIAISLLMLGAAVYSGFVVTPRIERLRDAAGVAPSSLSESDPRRVAFGRAHGLSTGLQLVPVAGGLLLLFWELRD